MQEVKYTDLSTFFQDAFQQNKIVPIIGSGYTKGLKTPHGSVPDGTQMKNYMIKSVISTGKLSEVDFEGESFSWVAGKFFDYVEPSKIESYFCNNFIGAKLSDWEKYFFTMISWDYFYTLNIDNAIENSVHSKYLPLFPNSDISESLKQSHRLFKMHGDALEYLKTKSKKSLILSETQYFSSIDSNRLFHDQFLSDYISKNILFIGCSMDDELDLKYTILSNNSQLSDKSNLVRRIFVTSEKLTTKKKEKLKDLCITDILKLECTADYESFYEMMVDCYNKSLSHKSKVGADYYKITNYNNLSDNVKENEPYLFSTKNIIDNNSITTPYFFIKRNTMSEYVNAENNIQIIVGRRVSGKTYLACGIASYYKDRNVYFVTSDQLVSEKTFKSLVNLKSSVLIFDSNTITDEQLLEILKSNSTFATRALRVYIFMNSSDEKTRMIDRYWGKETVTENLKHFLLGQEVLDIDNNLNAMKTIKYYEKYSILDNILRWSLTYQTDCLPKPVNKITTVEELVVFIWLAVHGKLYFDDIVTLGLLYQYSDIVRKFSPIIQIKPTINSEQNIHSGFKIVCNATAYLLKMLGEYVYPNYNTDVESNMINLHKDKVIMAIYRILVRFQQQSNSEKIIKFLMFDTLNDIFSKRYSPTSLSRLNGTENIKFAPMSGAAHVIQAIYTDKKIMKIRADEPNYWLQRAKAIYNFNRNNLKLLESAIVDCKKALGDSENYISKGVLRYYQTQKNTILQMAMIYGRIASLQKYSDVYYNSCAVQQYSECLRNEDMATYTLIKGSKGSRDFEQLINFITIHDNCLSIEYKQFADELVTVYKRIATSV
jgi:hypothetical protein